MAALVASTAPYLRLHPEERYFPMDPIAFLSASRFRHHRSLKADEGYNKKTELWVETNSYASEYYDVPIRIINSFGLDKAGKNRRPHDSGRGSAWQVFVQPKGKPIGNSSPSGRVPVFTHVMEESRWRGNAAATLIQYWWFLGYNDGYASQNHQGEWEHCTAAVQGGAVTGAYLAAHHTPHYYARNELEWKQGRFIVYSAKGSHASYPHEGTYRYGIDKTKRGGVEWQTWRFLRTLSEQPWKNFAGAWGEIGEHEITTGPLGPWYKRRKK